MFFIKIKVKGYLENKTESSKEIIDIYGIKNKNNISYIHNDISHKITILDNKVLLIRDNREFTHSLTFELGKGKKTEYYIKEYNTSIDVTMLTTKLNITENKLEVSYKIIDSGNEYDYIIEMSEK